MDNITFLIVMKITMMQDRIKKKKTKITFKMDFFDV